MSRAIIAEARLYKIASEIHPNVDLTGFVWSGALTKFEAKCKIHGPFETRPSYLTSGSGCPRCGIGKSRDNRRAKLFEIIAKFTAIHGDRYDYSKVIEVKNNKEKVIVTCQKHGDFEISVFGHLRGKNCKKCAKIASMKTRGIDYQTTGFQGRVFLTDQEIDTYRRRLPARLQVRNLPRVQYCAVCGGEEGYKNKFTMAHRVPFGAGILKYGLTPDWLDRHENLCWAHIKKCNSLAEYSHDKIMEIIDQLKTDGCQ